MGGRAGRRAGGPGARRAGRGDRACAPAGSSTSGRLFFAYGITDQSFDVWLASELEPGEQALEATEADLRVARVAVDELEAMIGRGEIADAATVAAWHLATR